MDNLKDFLLWDNGVTAIEYALIASLIAVIIVGAATIAGLKVQALFQKVETNIP